jgi:hypothetical protein
MHWGGSQQALLNGVTQRQWGNWRDSFSIIAHFKQSGAHLQWRNRYPLQRRVGWQLWL